MTPSNVEEYFLQYLHPGYTSQTFDWQNLPYWKATSNCLLLHSVLSGTIETHRPLNCFLSLSQAQNWLMQEKNLSSFVFCFSSLNEKPSFFSWFATYVTLVLVALVPLVFPRVVYHHFCQACLIHQQHYSVIM